MRIDIVEIWLWIANRHISLICDTELFTHDMIMARYFHFTLLFQEVVADAVNTDDPKDYAKVSVWDFGGQFVFYTTHQMFLTHRAIYILISNMSQHIEDVVIDDEPYFDCSGSQKFKIEGSQS